MDTRIIPAEIAPAKSIVWVPSRKNSMPCIFTAQTMVRYRLPPGIRGIAEDIKNTVAGARNRLAQISEYTVMSMLESKYPTTSEVPQDRNRK